MVPKGKGPKVLGALVSSGVPGQATCNTWEGLGRAFEELLTWVSALGGDSSLATCCFFPPLALFASSVGPPCSWLPQESPTDELLPKT